MNPGPIDVDTQFASSLPERPRTLVVAQYFFSINATPSSGQTRLVPGLHISRTSRHATLGGVGLQLIP